MDGPLTSDGYKNSNFHNFFLEAQNNPCIHISKSETPLL